MKKTIKKITAIAIACSLMLTGCSLSGNDEHEGTSGQITDDGKLSPSNNAGESNSSEIIIAEDLMEPDFDASSSGMSPESNTGENEDENSGDSSEGESEDDILRLVFFGDSQFANGTSDGTDIPTLVAQKVPNAISYNLGIGGTTASVEMTTSEIYNYENWTSNCFYGMVLAYEGSVDRNRLLANYPGVLSTMNAIDPSQVDYYFIEYGANDFFNKAPLDKYSNGNEDLNELYTYYGALSRGIEKLQELSPNATIVLITPFYGIYYAGDGTYIGDTYITSNGFATLQDYAKKMGNIAEDKGLYILDTMFQSKFDLYADTFSEYLFDTIHLTLKGRQVVARFLAHVPNTYEGFEPTVYRTTDYVYINNFDPDYYYKCSDETFAQLDPEEYQRYLNGEFLLAKPE